MSVTEAVGRVAHVVTRPDHPIVPAAVAGVATSIFVAARLAVAGQGNVARFVMAEQAYADPARLPHGVPVLAGNGYDGQFFYRLALDPANLHRSAFGIHLDTIFRLQRIGYPFLAWALSLGHHGWVPATLVVVNVAAMSAIGGLGGVVAKDAGRHALWGLLIAGYFGFVFSVGRDLSEPTTAAFLLGGIVAYRRNRPVLCGLLLACGALTRETALIAAGAILVSRLVLCLKRWPRPAMADLAWVIPFAAFAAWQVCVQSVVGQYPVLTDKADNSAGPLMPLIHAVGSHLRSAAALNADSLIWVLELIVLTVFIIAALQALRSTSAPGAERLMFVAYFVELFFLAPGIWDGIVDLRSLDEVYIFAVVVLFGSRRWRLAPFAAVLVPVLAIVAAHRIVSL